MFGKYAKLLTILVYLLCVHIVNQAATETKKYNNYAVIRVIPRNQRQLSFLKSIKKSHNIDYWQLPSKVNRAVEVMVKSRYKQTLFRQLSAHKLRKTIVISDVGRTITKNKNIGIRMRSIDGGFFRDFQKLSSINKFMHQLAKDYPEMASVISIGKSLENRHLRLMKVQVKNKQNKPIVWIDAGIHAREWIAPSTACFIINQLIDDFKSGDKQTQALLNTYDFFILPVVNPDGYVFSHQRDRLWRKNRKANHHSSGEECDGVDLNRNFNYKWNQLGYAKDYPCEQDFPGLTASSEPETKAMSKYIYHYRARIKYYISLHSFGQYLFYPYGWTTKKSPDNDDLHNIAVITANEIYKWYKTKFTLGQPSNVLYAAYGSSYDWAYGVAGIKYSYTFELRDEGDYGFLLPPTNIIPVGNETLIGIKAMISSSGSGRSNQLAHNNRGPRLRYLKRFYGRRIG